MYCIEESTYDIVGTSRRPGYCVPPRYAPEEKRNKYLQLGHNCRCSNHNVCKA